MAQQVAPQVAPTVTATQVRDRIAEAFGTTTGRWSVDTETASVYPRDYQHQMITSARRMGRTEATREEMIERAINPPAIARRSPHWGTIQVPEEHRSPAVDAWCAETTAMMNTPRMSEIMEQAMHDMLVYGRATVPQPTYHSVNDYEHTYRIVGREARFALQMNVNASCMIEIDALTVMMMGHHAFRGLRVIPGEILTYIQALERVFGCRVTVNQQINPGLIRITFYGEERRGRNER